MSQWFLAVRLRVLNTRHPQGVFQPLRLVANIGRFDVGGFKLATNVSQIFVWWDCGNMSGVRSPPKSEKDRIIRACEEGNLEDAVGNLERWKNDGDIVLAALEAVFNEDPDQVRVIHSVISVHNSNITCYHVVAFNSRACVV